MTSSDSVTLMPRPQDPANNRVEMALCRFRTPDQHCVLIGSKDAYHSHPIPVTRSDCLYCVQTLDLPRNSYSSSDGRTSERQWWKRWAKSTRDLILWRGSV